jgi:hypothetical protein
MKCMTVFMALFWLVVVASAQPPSNTDWIGIWHADMDGQPTGTLTLATDTGELGGTVVLDIVSREGGMPHVIASDPHVLLSPHVDGNRLTFQVRIKRLDGSVSLANFAVTRSSIDQASLHCTNCGINAPVVGLIRSR